MPRSRILVVDDEPGMLRAVERVLGTTYEVRTARLPSQALEAARAETYDLALLDIRMPEMDGFELMSRLAALQPRIDVILMTGSADERDARLARAIREKAFFFLTKPFDREVLLTLVERCLEVHRLDNENRSHVRRLERELQAAQVFQQSLLPERHASGAGVEIALRYEPTVELCGDFCDYVLEPDGPAAMILTDVAGHGASAAMLTGMIKQVFRDAAPEGHAPGVVLRRILAASRLLGFDRHLTAIAVRLDPGANTLEFVNAGHPAGLLLDRRGAIRRLDATAPLLHPDLDDWHCEPRVLALEPGEQLLLYTDGLTEARNAAGEEFGAERVERALTRLAAGGSPAEGHVAAVLEGLRAELAAFTGGRPLEDDLCMVLMRRK